MVMQGGHGDIIPRSAAGYWPGWLIYTVVPGCESLAAVTQVDREEAICPQMSQSGVAKHSSSHSCRIKWNPCEIPQLVRLSHVHSNNFTPTASLASVEKKYAC